MAAAGKDCAARACPRNWVRPPSPNELHLHPEILEVAAELCAYSDGPGLEPFVLERLVCAVVLADRVLQDKLF